MKKVILIMTVLSLLVSGLASCKKNKEEDVDLLKDDLSSYVEIDEKYYKGYTVVSNINVLAGNEIIKTLFKYRSAEPVEGDGVISVGDAVNIFYKGYYMKGAEKVYFDGGSNIGQASYKLEIGSGGFIPGFEYNMIGKSVAEYSASAPMVIETYFPSQYQSSELAGKTAYFEVYVEMTDGKYNISEYSVPDINEAYITETLKLGAEALSVYNGETLEDKYFDYVKTSYITKNNFRVDSLALTAFWESVLSGAVVKKYPQNQLKEACADIEADLTEAYSSNPYYSYYSLDEFICLSLGYSKNDDKDEAIMNTAKERIKQQLVFYQIMNQEGLKPTEAEYEKMFDEYVDNALVSNGTPPDSFASLEEYEAEKERFKSDIIKENGEDFFRSMFYYEIGSKAIIGYANIVEIPR